LPELKTIDIIGTGHTSILYDWGRDAVKWSVGSAVASYKENIDLYFCLHLNQSIDKKYKQMGLDEYPLKKIIELTKCEYFTNSIAYMIAYAVEIKKVKEINLFGIDIESGSEYAFERPCVAYWIAYARSKDVIVNNSAKLTEPVFKYGYDGKTQQRIIKDLQDRAEAYKRLASINEGDIKQQWVGAMFATNKIIDYIKG
jgi:hypothetical protein